MRWGHISLLPKMDSYGMSLMLFLAWQRVAQGIKTELRYSVLFNHLNMSLGLPVFNAAHGLVFYAAHI